MCTREPIQPIKVVVPSSEPVPNIPPTISPPTPPAAAPVEPAAKSKIARVRAKKVTAGKVKKDAESLAVGPEKSTPDETKSSEAEGRFNQCTIRISTR